MVHLLISALDHAEVKSINLTLDWSNCIINYLQVGALLDDKKEATRLRMKAASHSLLNSELYKMTYGSPWQNSRAQTRLNASLRKFTKATAAVTLVTGHLSDASYGQDAIGPP